MMLNASNDTPQRDRTSSPDIALNAAIPLRPHACVTLAGAPCSTRLSSADETWLWGVSLGETEQTRAGQTRTHRKKLWCGCLRTWNCQISGIDDGC